MLEDTDNKGAGWAALALTTSRLATDLRENRITIESARTIFRQARALLRDPAGFRRLEHAIETSAVDFISVAEAMADVSRPTEEG